MPVMGIRRVGLPDNPAHSTGQSQRISLGAQRVSCFLGRPIEVLPERQVDHRRVGALEVPVACVAGDTHDLHLLPYSVRLQNNLLPHWISISEVCMGPSLVDNRYGRGTWIIPLVKFATGKQRDLHCRKEVRPHR
jgi:hypothetical protein